MHFLMYIRRIQVEKSSGKDQSYEPVKSFLVFIRSGQISGKIKGLSDYEKVKAVHDYIILHNEYNRSSGGACNTLYRGDSACNGYALAFYIIMKKPESRSPVNMVLDWNPSICGIGFRWMDTGIISI